MSSLLRPVVAMLAAGSLLALAGCGSDDPESTSDGSTSTGSEAGSGKDGSSGEKGEAGSCDPANLDTLAEGKLTIATGQPGYEPWIVDDSPENGEGFEGAVAYAVAEAMGFEKADVEWTRVDFNAAIQPGPKDFDFDINQFSISDERRQAVDFSSPYYSVRQAVIALEGNKAAEATSLADLKDVSLGAQVGTTSLATAKQAIEPTNDPAVFNSNDDAKLALSNGQIDALVVDLPTAFFMTAVELADAGGTIVGQLPDVGGDTEEFGLVLDKGSSLTDCVSQAVDGLREDGTLAGIEEEWLADVADAPELS